MANNIETSERIDGPTPGGAAYSIAYYSRLGIPASKDLADAVEIVEYTSDGQAILRTYGRLST